MPRVFKDSSNEQKLNPKPQNEIFKVTSAKITTTQKGHTIFNLELDGLVWATMLKTEIRSAKRHGDELHEYYDEKVGNLDFLIGYYIAAEVEDSPYGKKIRCVNSVYPIEDFRKSLDESKGLAFSTPINIYKFLRKRGYPLNTDGSITLKAPYSGFNINGQFNGTVCYPNNPGENTLTINNIQIIYDKFFKNKGIDTYNPDRSEDYCISSIAIGVYRVSYHEHKTGIESTYRSDFYTVGEKLKEEHIAYLNELKSHANDNT